MAEDKLTSGEAYTFTLKQWLEEIIANHQIVKFNYLSGRCDAETLNLDIAAITNFYTVLNPKIQSHKGSPGWAELIKEWDDWKEWIRNPTYFQQPGSFNALDELEETIIFAAEKLDITYFPKAQGREI